MEKTEIRRERKINLHTSISELLKITEEQLGWKKYRDKIWIEGEKEKAAARHGRESEENKIQSSQ